MIINKDTPLRDILLLLGVPSNKTNIEILKKFAYDIIEECAGNFECTMEDDDLFLPPLSDTRKMPQHPVLVRQSILAVKNLIK